MSETKLQQMKDLPDNYLECRNYVYHSLHPLGAFWYTFNGTASRCLVSECDRCGSMRLDYLYSNGKLRRRTYDRPENYLLTGTGKRPRLEQVRNEFMSRMHIFESRDDMPVGHKPAKIQKRRTLRAVI